MTIEPVNHICSNCNEPCEAVAETFDYAATHATHGKAGKHYTGIYLSDCCLEELGEEDE